MKLKNSLAIPIILLMVVVACCTLYIGYYINIHSLRSALENTEREKDAGVYFTISSLIKKESDFLLSLSKITSQNPELAQTLAFYYQSPNDLRPLMAVMNQLYSHLGTDIFLVTDARGLVLYRANLPPEKVDIHQAWGMDEALSGQDIVATGPGPQGMSIRAMSPVYHDGKVCGVVMLGTLVGDKFAQRIADATHTNISFGLGSQVLASSLPASRRGLINLESMERSLELKITLFQMDYDHTLSFMYAPLKVEDQMFCLIINTDTTAVTQLLREKQRQLYSSFLPIFLVVVGLGSGLTLSIIRPLKRLQQQALNTIEEFGGKDAAVQQRGNEIQTLAQAFNLLLTVIHQHIDGLNHAQETIQKGKRFLASIFDSILDGVVILDKDLNLVRVNRATERLFLRSMPLVGKKCYVAFHARQAPCNHCPTLMTLKTGAAAHRIFLNDDPILEKPLWVELNTYPLMDPASGQVTGVIEYFRDITERRRTEEALRQSEEQLRQLQKIEAVGRLAGGVAHDFNNMLTAIGGYCDLILERLPADSPQRQDVLEIKKAADRSTTLTRQLLAFSRKQILQPKPLNLNEVLNNLEKMVRRLLSEDIDLLTISGPELGWVLADPGQIEQVILNLVINARDAMPQGGKLTIETDNVTLDAAYARNHLEVHPGPYVRLSVSDTGIGMDEEARSHVFEPFFTTKEWGRGTGLGLSTVYGIIKQSGGHIWVYSESGQGTTFKVYLPRVDPPAEAAAPPSLPTAQTHGSETILLVEDEGVVRQVTVRMLERSGYKVLPAANGPEALALSRKHAGPIHLLLTDVLMPGMSGRELADHLLLLNPNLRVLYMSGHTENAIVHHGVLESGIAFIQKPFRHDALVRKVREVLDAPNDRVASPQTS